MEFGRAVEGLKGGASILREGWNGKGMYLTFQRGKIGNDAYVNGQSVFDGVHLSLFDLVPGKEIHLPYIVMRTASGSFVPWLASQTDILATDWIFKED